MTNFLIELVVFGAITGAATLFVARIHRLARRRFKRRNWILTAAAISVATAGIGWTSRDLTSKCLLERNEGCVDPGGAGWQFLLVGGFVVWALSTAYFVWNE